METGADMRRENAGTTHVEQATVKAGGSQPPSPTGWTNKFVQYPSVIPNTMLRVL